MIQIGIKLPDGQMPQYEVFDLRKQGKPIRIRFNFSEEETEHGLQWNFMYVTVPDLQESTLRNVSVPEEISNLIAQ